MTTFFVALASFGLGSLVTLFVKSYLGSYASEKAKNRATFQDIPKLVAQVHATEEVKAQVSTKTWALQSDISAKKAHLDKLSCDYGEAAIVLVELLRVARTAKAQSEYVTTVLTMRNKWQKTLENLTVNNPRLFEFRRE
jgi:hypothetical protein